MKNRIRIDKFEERYKLVGLVLQPHHNYYVLINHTLTSIENVVIAKSLRDKTISKLAGIKVVKKDLSFKSKILDTYGIPELELILPDERIEIKTNDGSIPYNKTELINSLQELYPNLEDVLIFKKSKQIEHAKKDTEELELSKLIQ